MKTENVNVQEQKKRGRKPLVNPLMKYWVKTIKNLPATDYNTEKYDVNKMQAAFDEALEQTKSFDDKRLVNTIVQMPLIISDKNEEINKLYNTINNQTEELDGAYNKIANLEKANKELESLRPIIENYKIVLKNKDITIDSLRQEIEDLNKDVTKLTTIKDEAVTNYKDKCNQITNLQGEISNYKKSLKSYKVAYWIAFSGLVVSIIIDIVTAFI